MDRPSGRHEEKNIFNGRFLSTFRKAGKSRTSAGRLVKLFLLNVGGGTGKIHRSYSAACSEEIPMVGRNAMVAAVLSVVCGSAPAVFADDIPAMGRIADFDHSACGVAVFTEVDGEAGRASGTYMGMTAEEFCACVWFQVGESVRPYLNCRMPE